MTGRELVARPVEGSKNCDLLIFEREQRDYGNTRRKIQQKQMVRLFPLSALPLFPRDFQRGNAAGVARGHLADRARARCCASAGRRQRCELGGLFVT